MERATLPSSGRNAQFQEWVELQDDSTYLVVFSVLKQKD